MSTTKITVTTVDKVSSHDNADNLELVLVGGWQCVVKKGEYSEGDKVVYFPPDTLIPQSWTDKFGVTNYCSEKDNDMRRINRAKLRGQNSFGLVVRPEQDWDVDTDVTDFYGAEKYNPPVKFQTGDAGPEDPFVPRYTDIENLRGNTRVFNPGEEVILTEKIHGTNVRIALVEGEKRAGSRKHMRKPPEDFAISMYWYPWSRPEIVAMMESLGVDYQQVVVYGETFGKVQNLKYNVPNGIDFRVFDMIIDDEWVNYDDCVRICDRYGVQMVPLIARIPYDLEKIAEFSEGTTRVNDADHMREGVVVKPVVERRDHKVGRVILKYVSDTYLMSKHGNKNDNTDE